MHIVSLLFMLSTFRFLAVGFSMEVTIISHGAVTYYVRAPALYQHLPVIPSEVHTVNLTWEAGSEMVSIIGLMREYIAYISTRNAKITRYILNNIHLILHR